MKQEDISVMTIAIVPLIGGIISLLFTMFLWYKVKGAKNQDDSFTKAGTKSQQVEISEIVQNGAMTFLVTEYLYLLPFVIAMCMFFFIEEWITNTTVYNQDGPGGNGFKMIICFICGASLSGASGWAGMLIATDCNVKTAQACKGDPGTDPEGKSDHLNDGLVIAFTGGAVMGFVVVGLGITGLTILFIAFAYNADDSSANEVAYSIHGALYVLSAFSFGASAIALFARVAGGIYTKAADVGADLVGKVESDFPEDSYYNAATIADNVGDNVGDVAGMGADLFESYVGSIVAAATLALTSNCNSDLGYEFCSYDLRRVALPFWVAGFGIVASLVGFFAVSTKADTNNRDELMGALLFSLHKGVYSAAVLSLIFSAVSVFLLYDNGNTDGFTLEEGFKDYVCLVIGLLIGILIGEATEIFTAYEYSPTQSITKAGITGPATVIIQGLGIGMLSAVPPVILVAVAVMACDALSGVYGAALASVGMLSTLGVTLATDAYGPVADNAGGIAEMAHLPKEVRERTDALDALGNTTAATGKGFAVGSAVLTALAFMNAFADRVKLNVIDGLAPADCNTVTGGTGAYANVTSAGCAIIRDMSFDGFFTLTDPLVLSGLLIGAMLPFLFAALTMLSVGKAAQGIILNVREQLSAKPMMKGLVQLSEHDEFDNELLKSVEGIDTMAAKIDPAKGGEEGFTPLTDAMLAALKASITSGANQSAHPLCKGLENFGTANALVDLKPNYDECVRVSTESSLEEMIIPGIIAILTPIGLGLLVGARCLGGLLMGAIASGFLLAVMMNNAGGAWDNSKKWIENEAPRIGPKLTAETLEDELVKELINRETYDAIKGRMATETIKEKVSKTKKGKMKDWHSAVVTGDTVGDPFKDTSGPALNILIKLMSVLSLTCAGLFKDNWKTWGSGVIVLAVEFLLLVVAYYYVWESKDGDALTKAQDQAANDDATLVNSTTPGVYTELEVIAPEIADIPAIKPVVEKPVETPAEAIETPAEAIETPAEAVETPAEAIETPAEAVDEAVEAVREYEEAVKEAEENVTEKADAPTE